MNDGPKILTLDIETSPHLCYSFETWNTNIRPDQIIKPSRMTCWSAKWLHGDRVLFASEFHDGPEAMVVKMRDLLDAADIVVTYNGDKFDILRLNREFRLLGLVDPSPYISVDLYKVIKKRERWASHKLAYLTEQLELSGKMDNDGWELWLAIEGVYGEEAKRKAWIQMRRYSKRDSLTTEELFVEYRPNITTIPHVALFDDEFVVTDEHCPTCNSSNTIRRGWRYTKTRRYPRRYCNDCGRWFSTTRSESGVLST